MLFDYLNKGIYVGIGIEKIINVYWFLYEGKKIFWETYYRHDVNIKTFIRETGYDGMGWNELTLAGSYCWAHDVKEWNMHQKSPSQK